MGRAQSIVQRAFTLTARGIGSRVVAGAGFKLAGTLVRAALTIGSTAVLARLLLPADYGYVAMATIVTELAALFATAGMTDMLVQRRRISRIQLDTTFWALLLIGIALAGSVALVSVWAGAIFGDPEVRPLVLTLGLLFPINSLGCVSAVLMNRLMDFKAEFYISTFSLLIRSVAAIFAARAGMGAWSLVIGAFVGSMVTVVLSFFRYPFMPRQRFSVHYLYSSWRVSSLYLSSGLVYYVNMNADLLLVSRFWGAAPLGLYQNARALADELRSRLAAPLAQTLFPAFSSVRADTGRAADLFIRSSRVLAASILLLGGTLSATSREIVELLYGPRWMTMVPLVSLFAISAAIRGATALASPLLNANNRPGYVLKQHAITTALMIAGVVAMLPYGVRAVALAVAVTSLYTLVPYCHAVRVFGFTVRSVVHVMGGPIAAALACVASVEIIRWLCAPWDPGPLLRLALFGAAGVTAYTVTLTWLARAHVHELVDIAQRLLRARKPSQG